jgi:hypothetical protein
MIATSTTGEFIRGVARRRGRARWELLALAAVATLILGTATPVRASRQTAYGWCPTNYVEGISASGGDSLNYWGSAGQSDGTCYLMYLGGWYQCYDGYYQSMSGTWQTSGFGQSQLCGGPNVEYSYHTHNGCPYVGGGSSCSGYFATYSQD